MPRSGFQNIRHGLLLNEYPQEFDESIMNPSRSNHPSSDTIYQNKLIIPNVKGISEKFIHTENHFKVSTIFKTNIHSV